jgi:hypothetical protein
MKRGHMKEMNTKAMGPVRRVSAAPRRVKPALSVAGLTALCVMVSTLALANLALAHGMELLPGGTRSVGRGGAVAARPEDPMALLHNPAGLALLSGQQIMLDVDVSIHSMCVDPYGYYGWGVYGLNLALQWAADPGMRPLCSAPIDPARLAVDPLRRLRLAGKPAKLALTACMRKLVVTLNAVLRTGTAWKQA